MNKPKITSRLAGFYRRSIGDRLRTLVGTEVLSERAADHLASGGGLSVDAADRMSENVIATHGLPFALGLNFRINDTDYLVPMAIEEPSVVAAASNAARMVRKTGGFHGEADAPIMTAQIQLDAIATPAAAAETIAAHGTELLAAGDASIPRMVQRGGGCRDIDVRVLDRDSGMIVVSVHVDVGDAMGANMIDTVAEAVAPQLQKLIGGRIGLRILTNLSLRRRVRVRAEVGEDAVGGADIAEKIARASVFAELDIQRAATHNKGIMNGIDAVAVATGQDWRAIEAGAHAFASLDGTYRPLASWKRTAGGLVGELEMPMAVGVVGGSTGTHPGVRAALELLQLTGARELAIVIASVGLASNLAALRALAGEGIQKGHMRLHRRRIEEQPEKGANVERARSQ